MKLMYARRFLDFDVNIVTASHNTNQRQAALRKSALDEIQI